MYLAQIRCLIYSKVLKITGEDMQAHRPYKAQHNMHKNRVSQCVAKTLELKLTS